MTRLTTPQGDYCRDVCGCRNTCPRLQRGQPPCKDAQRYQRLRQYENTGREPEEIKPYKKNRRGIQDDSKNFFQ